jgi:hypothetical protein
MNFLTLISLALVASVAISEKATFNGYKLFRVTPNNAKHIELFQDLEVADNDFDVWSVNRITGTVDVLLSPSSIPKYRRLFKTSGMKYEVLVDDIQEKIEEQQRSMSRSGDSKNIIFKYARYNEIVSFVDQTVADNSDIASSYVAGTTVENRQLKVIKIKAPNTSTNRAVWMDCGIHAREWVTPATCVYIIDQLIKEYRANEPGNLLAKYEVHVMPIVNADGYEYAHNTFRLWRKNRSVNPGSTCIGTDLNRNFGYGWLTGGSSTNPCSDTFAGPAADSERETKAIENSINAKIGQWDAYINIHSYGNWWLTPWGNSTTVRPSNYNDLIAKGQIGADAIKNYKNQGQVFRVGSSSTLLYINSGSSKDWARGTANIPYSYVLELRPGDSTPDGVYGFTLPEDRMPLVAPETFAGIKAFLAAV